MENKKSPLLAAPYSQRVVKRKVNFSCRSVLILPSWRHSSRRQEEIQRQEGGSRVYQWLWQENNCNINISRNEIHTEQNRNRLCCNKRTGAPSPESAIGYCRRSLNLSTCGRCDNIITTVENPLLPSTGIMDWILRPGSNILHRISSVPATQ